MENKEICENGRRHGFCEGGSLTEGNGDALDKLVEDCPPISEFNKKESESDISRKYNKKK